MPDPATHPVLVCVAARVVPGSARLPPEDAAEMWRLVRDALHARPPALRRQLGLFLTLVRLLPLPRYGRPFERLPPDGQDAVLRWLQDSPLAPLRQGFWGVRTLIYMGYYGRPGVGPQIGWTPSRNGNATLRTR